MLSSVAGRRRWWLYALPVLLLTLSSARASRAQEATSLGVLELHFTPVPRAQIAIWLERDGVFVTTVRLTEAVGLRGLGNRPGASQMNSGFRWPYGRREGVLPVWASRRASQPGAQLFRRVIFQDRAGEGYASATSGHESSIDNYYCLQWDKTRARKDALDAVSCASVFRSDKGRFITERDLSDKYSEPYMSPGAAVSHARTLSLYSLYPPRRDMTPCIGCGDYPDVASYVDHVRSVMPDIDSVTMATPAGHVEQHILHPIAPGTLGGNYRACVEVNVEGDYNWAFNETTYPTPQNADNEYTWDEFARSWGYPYRGQPSIVYCADIALGGDVDRTSTTDNPLGTAGIWDVEDPQFGSVRGMGDMTLDPVAAPGSGGDRLLQDARGHRLEVNFKPSSVCRADVAPTGVSDVSISLHPDELHAHEWARVRFGAAGDDAGVYRYDIRVSTQPFTDDASFLAGTAAKQASLEAAELMVPTSAAAGEPVVTDIGGLIAQTHYYVAVRALDACAVSGPFAVAEFTTPSRKFATVSPCFVATAAFGSPLAHEIGALRRLRDRQLASTALGRAFVAAYDTYGPRLADVIRPSAKLRAFTRAVLAPVIALARLAGG